MDTRAVERFWQKVEKTDTCWLWKAALTRGGYGQFAIAKQPRRAHRIAYSLVNGAIPDELEIDHRCFVRACVKPDHLQVVTRQTNVLRSTSPSALYAARSHCSRGHEYLPGSYTTRVKRSPGARLCKRCNADYQQRRRDLLRQSLGNP
jgi:hypothetical protein